MARKLFRVTLRDVNTGFSAEAYAVADDINEACKKVLKDGNVGVGYVIVQTVELIAEDADFPRCGTRLYL